MIKFKKKHSFILLEVMIGIFLVTLLALPLISSSLAQHKNQIKDLYRLETERVLAETIAEITDLLYKNIPSYLEITRQGARKVAKPLPSLRLSANNDQIKVKRSYTIHCVKNKKFELEDSSSEYRLLQIEIDLTTTDKAIPLKQFTHYVMVKSIVQ